MSENIKAFKILSAEIKKYIQEYLKSASFDVTRVGIVTEVLDENKYFVKIDGTVFAVPSITGEMYSVNDVVSVLYPQNKDTRKRIVGREV